MKDTISKKAFKAGTWYTISNFLLKGIGFISTPIFTRLMSKTEYGDYSNYTAWASIIAILVTLEMSGCVYRARYDYEEDFDGFLSSIVVCGSLITGICYAIVCIFMKYFVLIFDMDSIYIHLMFLTVLISPALSILQAKHRILQKYKSFVALSVGTTVVSTLASLWCVCHMEDKLFGRIIGMVVPMLVVYLLVYILVAGRGRVFYNKEYWRYAVAFSLPLVPHLLSNTILGSSDRIMIKQLCSAQDAAVYSVAYSCGMIVSILFTSLNQAWEPWLFDRVHEGDYEAVKKASRYYLLFFVILVMGSILVAPELIYIMGGQDYYQAVYAIPPVMAGYGCKFAYTFYVNMERFEKKTKYISIGTIAAAVLNVVLNFIFIPRFGYIAAAYTTLAGFAALVLLHYYMSRRMGITGMYDNRFVFLMVALMLVLGPAAGTLYSLVFWLRWLIIAMIALICSFMGLFVWKLIKNKNDLEKVEN